MRKFFGVIGSGFIFLLYFSTIDAEELESLRGSIGVAEINELPELKLYQRDREPIVRDYVQQPPLIPHKINNYQINLKFNKCLSCHSWANYRKSRATKISQTHFADRDRSVSSNVAARRYFCTQCHVPQVNAVPLIDNYFEPLKVMGKH